MCVYFISFVSQNPRGHGTLPCWTALPNTSPKKRKTKRKQVATYQGLKKTWFLKK